MEEEIKEHALLLGADVCGIASIDRFEASEPGFRPRDVYSKCNSVIVVGIALPIGVFEANTRISYSHFNANSCRMVDDISFRLAKYIEKTTKKVAVPIPSDEPYEYWDKEKLEGRGTISMKHAAVAAGLGTLGKNTLFLNEKYGNRLTIGAILTELTLVSDPVASSICLTNCRLCLESCPAHALDGTKANQALCRPVAYGVTKKGGGIVTCNQCRNVCPRRNGIKKSR